MTQCGRFGTLDQFFLGVAQMVLCPPLFIDFSLEPFIQVEMFLYNKSDPFIRTSMDCRDMKPDASLLLSQRAGEVYLFLNRMIIFAV